MIDFLAWSDPCVLRIILFDYDMFSSLFGTEIDLLKYHLEFLHLYSCVSVPHDFFLAACMVLVLSQALVSSESNS